LTSQYSLVLLIVQPIEIEKVGTELKWDLGGGVTPEHHVVW